MPGLNGHVLSEFFAAESISRCSRVGPEELITVALVTLQVASTAKRMRVVPSAFARAAAGGYSGLQAGSFALICAGRAVMLGAGGAGGAGGCSRGSGAGGGITLVVVICGAIGGGGTST